MTEANYKNTIWLSFFGLVLFFLFVPTLFGSAAFSETINYQGKLMDDAGNLVADGSYNMRFRLCADDACTSVLYDESWVGSDKVAVTNGLFSVLIGSVSSTLGSVDFNQDVYLEVSVGGNGAPSWEALTPRKKLGAVPNAFNSKKFDGLTTSSIAVLDRENTFSENISFLGSSYFAGNVGIGTMTPSTTLHVVGTSTFQGDISVSGGLLDSSGNYGTNGQILLSTGISTLWVSTSTLGIFGGISVESDPIFMSASTSLPYQPIGSYLTVETDPIWSLTSTSVAYLANSQTFTGENTFQATTSLPYGSWIGSALGTNSIQFTDYTIPTTFAAGNQISKISAKNDLNILAMENTLLVVAEAGEDPAIGLAREDSNYLTLINSKLDDNSFEIFQVDETLTQIPYSEFLIGTEKLSLLSGSATSTLNFNDSAEIALSPDDTMRFTGASGGYYFGDSTSTFNSILPSADLTYSLGSSNVRWGDIWGGSLNVSDTSTVGFLTVTNSINSNLLPLYDVTYSLGTSTHRWNSIWGSSLNLVGSASVGSLITSNVGSDLLPSADLTYSLGSSTLRWDNIWGNSLNLSGSATMTSLFVNGTTTINEMTIENGLSFSGSLQKMADNLELPHKARNLYIADDYAYVVTYATNSVDSFRIVDISNPSHPRVVGGAGLTGLPLSDGKRVWASGNYAYLLYNASIGITNPFRIIDISDKSNPVVISGEDLELSGLTGSAGQPFYVSGKYAYVMGSETMHIIDISDPYNPKLISSLSDVGATNWDVKVSGDYAYVCSRKIIDGEANPLTIVNIKDKANPFIVKEMTISDLATSTNLCWSLDVSGPYVYLGLGTLGPNSSTESFRIVDVSNPSNPVVKGGREIGTNSDSSLALDDTYTAFNYVKILGTRLYATTWASDFLIIDVASSTDPEIISKTSIFGGGDNSLPLTFDFRGNYVSVGYAPILSSYSTSTDYFRIFKLPGADIWGGHSDAFSAGSLQVLNNAVFNQRLTVWDSLEVGSGGLYSQGAISVMATNTPSYFGGSIGIGTTTPTYKLSVYASSTSDYLLQVATSTNLGIFEIRNDGIGRFGGDLIVGGNSTTTGNMVISGTGTSTIAGNLQIAQGKVLQVETIIAYSPLNINTGMIVSGNVTTTGQSTVDDTVTRSVVAHCGNSDYDNQGDCESNGETWYATADHDFTTQMQTGGYGYFPVLNSYFNSGVYGYSTSTDTTNGNIGAVGVYGKASTVGVAGVGDAIGGFFYGTGNALMTIGSNLFIGSGTFSTNSFHVGSGSNSLLSINAGTIGLGQYSAPSEFFGVQPSTDAGEVATARFKTWNNVDQLYLDSTGKVGVGTTTPQESFVVAGNAIFTGDVTALSVTETSDANLKENVEDLVYGMDDIMKLRPVSFDYIANGRHSLGFIAQEVKEVIPELVHGSEGSYSLNYSIMTSLLTRGIQQQQEEIENLKVLVGAEDSVTELSVSSDPEFNVDSLRVASAVTFQGTITVIGEAGFKSKVTFSDHVYFTGDSAGIATVQTGATSTEVKFSKPYESTPVITITPKKKLSGVNWWVENETPEGFVIAVDPTIDEEIQFNWHAVAVLDSSGNEITEQDVSDTNSDTESSADNSEATEGSSVGDEGGGSADASAQVETEGAPEENQGTEDSSVTEESPADNSSQDSSEPQSSESDSSSSGDSGETLSEDAGTPPSDSESAEAPSPTETFPATGDSSSDT